MSNAKGKQISLEKAKNWTKTWRREESNYNRYNECKAFNIPLEDFKGVLAEPGVASVRAYLAVKTHKNGTQEEKLLIVGVDKFGKDMINPTGSMLGNDDGDGSGIFDFTEPCPDLCDDGSPLNGG